MARRRRSTVALSAEQAQKALAVLVQEGKLTAREVLKALQRRDRLIRALRDSLAALGENAGRVGKRLFRAGALSIKARRGGAAKPKMARRKPRISAATRKKFQTQGRYMAALRNLSKGSRAKIKAIRKKSGVEAAIAAAKEMAK
jgi:plasmid stabilization system protein ParE